MTCFRAEAARAQTEPESDDEDVRFSYETRLIHFFFQTPLPIFLDNPFHILDGDSNARTSTVKTAYAKLKKRGGYQNNPQVRLIITF